MVFCPGLIDWTDSDSMHGVTKKCFSVALRTCMHGVLSEIHAFVKCLVAVVHVVSA